MTIDYTATREQFGVAIGSFQAVKHKVADMAKLLRGARAATYLAAMALDARLPEASLHASVAKAFASEQVSARSEEHTSELQSLMRISYAVFCLKTQNKTEY